MLQIYILTCSCFVVRYFLWREPDFQVTEIRHSFRAPCETELPEITNSQFFSFSLGFLPFPSPPVEQVLASFPPRRNTTAGVFLVLWLQKPGPQKDFSPQGVKRLGTCFWGRVASLLDLGQSREKSSAPTSCTLPPSWRASNTAPPTPRCWPNCIRPNGSHCCRMSLKTKLILIHRTAKGQHHHFLHIWTGLFLCRMVQYCDLHLWCLAFYVGTGVCFQFPLLPSLLQDSPSRHTGMAISQGSWGGGDVSCKGRPGTLLTGSLLSSPFLLWS